MDPTRIELIQDLFDQALVRPLHERSNFLASVTHDRELIAEVQSLLEAHEGHGRLDSILGRLHALRPAGLAAEPALGARLQALLGDRYQMERELGRGGMAVVFLAEDLRHRRKVALKILRPELTHDLGSARFLKEIAIVARLAHPNVLPLHDSGEVDGLLYFVMPYVAGESLRTRLIREGRLPVHEALVIAREVADALSHAHAHGVVHRDVKPENILLEAGHAVVSDFGIARAMTVAGGDDLAEAAIAPGTPAYMSPEQARGDPELDGRSDVYSLGCVLHEMLAGVPPFRGNAVESVLEDHLSQPAPELPDSPAIVARAVRRAMAKSRDDRFETAAAFERALEEAAVVVATAPVRSRRRVARMAFAGLLVAAVPGAVMVLLPRAPVHPAASVMAVLPFVPLTDDPELSQLGRDLVVTLSTSIDDVSEIRTVAALTILAQTLDRGALSAADELRLARRLGASSALRGTLSRAGGKLRVDATLVAADDGRSLGRATLALDAADLGVVTDSLAWRVLRAVWRRRAPPTPNLTALTTRSLPALRAFLEGERAALENRWDAAAPAYARAMSADSTFWLAYWRYAFARWWYLEAVDNDVIAKLSTHRYALPERDRLVFESWVTDTFSVALARSTEVVTRYADYWPGFMQHADWLFHVGPVYGYERSDAMAALERTVALNPRLIPAWEHLYWASLPDDTAAATRAVEALTQVGFGRASTSEFGFDITRVYRLELAYLQRGTLDLRLRDSIVVDLLTTARGRLGSGATLAPVQIAISERVLRARPRPELMRLHERLLADAWASRGAWDSALVIADRSARVTAGVDPLDAYRLATLGVWLGVLPPERALEQRSLLAARSERTGRNAMWEAERAWLDGLLAVANRDERGLNEARERLRGIDTISTVLLDRTLGAFETELLGERRLAAATLAATNWQNPDLLVPGYSAHPYVIAVSRFAAARWLVAEGDTADAMRLLKWFEAEWGLDGYRPARRVMAALAALERGRIGAAQGRHRLARQELTSFLRRYDAPAPAHRALVDEARAALSLVTPGPA